jgi:diadenosine tetraphosphate (Ap4A) HIT family hydrolase
MTAAIYARATARSRPVPPSTRSCAFCCRAKVIRRLFYEDERWRAFLAAPYHVRGHTILAAVPRSTRCPRQLDERTLEGLSGALVSATEILNAHYGTKDVLIASLRGDLRHFHFHLIPQWGHEEDVWWKVRGYDHGHLLAYLGDLESRGDHRALLERERRGWTGEKQRRRIERELAPDVAALRRRASPAYRPGGVRREYRSGDPVLEGLGKERA